MQSYVSMRLLDPVVRFERETSDRNIRAFFVT
jgi:hypothetical protein